MMRCRGWGAVNRPWCSHDPVQDAVIAPAVFPSAVAIRSSSRSEPQTTIPRSGNDVVDNKLVGASVVESWLRRRR